ncbi:MAG: hypothetical protein LBU73_06565 [Helicobacteraceae bacterium]|jgi:hypothetical protein|nr:hypothetical protein [Helicobacteraceae bacterium]
MKSRNFAGLALVLPLILAFLAACGDAERENAASLPKDAVELRDGATAIGDYETKIYADRKSFESLFDGETSARIGRDMPILITDGATFAAQIDAALRGKKLYIESGGAIREVIVTAASGETQFIKF